MSCSFAVICSVCSLHVFSMWFLQFHNFVISPFFQFIYIDGTISREYPSLFTVSGASSQLCREPCSNWLSQGQACSSLAAHCQLCSSIALKCQKTQSPSKKSYHSAVLSTEILELMRKKAREEIFHLYAITSGTL